MFSEQRLRELEARLDRIAASNFELRESVEQLEKRFSANRVEILALRYQVDRSPPPLPPPAAIQATGSPPLPHPAAIQVNPLSRPKVQVRDSSAPPLQLVLPPASASHQSPHSSITTPLPATLRDELDLLGNVAASIANSTQPTILFPAGSLVTIHGGKSRARNAGKLFSVVRSKGKNYTYIVDVDPSSGPAIPIYKANTSLSLAVDDEECTPPTGP